MGTSYLEFRGNGFWTRDPVVEVVLGRLVLELADRREQPELQRDWALQATAGFIGCINAGLDDLSPEAVGAVQLAIPDCMNYLSNDEAVVDDVRLRQLALQAGVDDPRVPAALTSLVMPAFAALGELLNGSLPFPAGGRWFVSNTGLTPKNRAR